MTDNVDGIADNLEFLYVDGLEQGAKYEPPEYLAPYVDHEVVSPDEKEKYSLKALAEMERDSPTPR